MSKQLNFGERASVSEAPGLKRFLETQAVARGLNLENASRQQIEQTAKAMAAEMTEGLSQDEIRQKRDEMAAHIEGREQFSGGEVLLFIILVLVFSSMLDKDNR